MEAFKTKSGRFLRMVCIALAMVAISSPGLLLAEDPPEPVPPTLPDLGVNLPLWITVIAGVWFGLIAVVVGYVVGSKILFKGINMLKRYLTPTR